MPLPGHLEITGVAQGKIDGDCLKEGRENTITVFAMDQNIHVPRNPEDGLPTGKRIHEPLMVVKGFDKASPKLYQALCQSEDMTVVMRWYRPDEVGGEENYFTHKLETARIISIRPYFPLTFVAESAPYRHMEEISFTYRKITWTWEIDGVESEDSWLTPG